MINAYMRGCQEVMVSGIWRMEVPAQVGFWSEEFGNVEKETETLTIYLIFDRKPFLR